MALKGTAAGASIGSVIPGVGTLIGGVVGGLGGAAAGVIAGIAGNKNKRAAEEQANLMAVNSANAANTRMNEEAIAGFMRNNVAAKGGLLFDVNQGKVNDMNRFLINRSRINTNPMNRFAYGGHTFPNNLTEFDEGNTHEANSLGGIPQGIGENGEPNLVEEGETKWNDYIFSNRLKIGKKEINKFLLPKNIKGKTFADASKKLSEESKEREFDTISQRGHTDSMVKLMVAQETQKQEQEMRDNKQQVMMALGGYLNKRGKKLLAEGGSLANIEALVNNPANRSYIAGGKADREFRKNSTNVDHDQLNAGIRVEMEHTNDAKKAREIALDHLKEDPQYYTKLIESGIVDEKIPGNVLQGLGVAQQQFKRGGNLFFGGGPNRLNEPVYNNYYEQNQADRMAMAINAAHNQQTTPFSVPATGNEGMMAYSGSYTPSNPFLDNILPTPTKGTRSPNFGTGKDLIHTPSAEQRSAAANLKKNNLQSGNYTKPPASNQMP